MDRPLDRIDREILAALQKNARLSNKEVAARAGLAPSSCLERIRRLRADGVLRGAHADVEPRSLGIALQAILAVRLGRHSRELVRSFREHVDALPEVVAIYHIAGGNDFLLHVAVRDVEHLRDVALDSFTTRPEVEHLETAIIFDHARRWELPDYVSPPEA